MNIQDWRPIIRRVFAGIWLYLGFLLAWAVAAHIWDVPAFAWAWVWVPFQWLAWACGGWFLVVAAAWGVIEAQEAAQRVWGRSLRSLRVTTTQTAPTGVVVPTVVLDAPAIQDRPGITFAQLVYDHMRTRTPTGGGVEGGGRSGEMLDEMREAGLFILNGVPEPADAAEFSKRLDDAGWPKLPDKHRAGYPGWPTSYRHVDQIEFDDRCTFRPTP